MTEAFWFNMWTKRLCPYRELQVGDTLLWYETPSRSVRWRSEVTRVDTFKYSSKHEAAEQLRQLYGPFDQGQEYFVSAPAQGYCLAWAVKAVERLDLERPPGFRFAINGWMKVKDIKEVWPELPV